MTIMVTPHGCVYLFQQIEYSRSRVWIKGAGSLIAEQHLGIRGKGSGYGDSLLLSAESCTG